MQTKYTIASRAALAITDGFDGAAAGRVSKTEKSGTVPGFSRRFQLMLDYAGFPPMGDGRINLGAEIFQVSKSGFRGWCQFDTPPRVFAELRRVVRLLLARADRDDVLPEAAIGWLYVGELRGDPFNHTVINDSLSQETYVSVRIVANKLRVDFNGLNAKTQDMLLIGAGKYAEKLVERGAKAQELSTNTELERFITSLMEVAGG